MIICGSIPFYSFEEKITIIKNLKKEFNNKVFIEVLDDLILYKHIAPNNKNKINVDIYLQNWYNTIRKGGVCF